MIMQITDADLPARLDGKVAVITGGCSGIGLAAAKILATRGCQVHVLDLNPPEELSPGIEYINCDVSSWAQLCAAFQKIGPRLDIAIANAGISETSNFLEDSFDENTGELLQPNYALIDVNYIAVLNFVKLAVRLLKKNDQGGSIVITSSATAYAPEQSLPVYSATKNALIGLVRALRHNLRCFNISINSVAPAATVTKLLPQNLATPLMAAGLPVSSAQFVGRAVVFSATAQQTGEVEPYGKDDNGIIKQGGKWNGRVILTLGDIYTEIEEPIAKLKTQWLGEKVTTLTRMQQTATDFRSPRGTN